MTFTFPDVSHYQAGLSLRGARAVLAKATQGIAYTDTAYAGFRAQATGLGIPFGAYHWLDSTDPGAQARHCYAVVGPGVPLMIDDEQDLIRVDHTLAFVSAYRALGGRVVLEYAPRSVWQRSGRPDLRPLASAGLALVSSQYPSTGYSDAGPGWNAYGGVTPVIWQWSDSELLNGRRVDMNAYRGSVDQFRALLRSAQEDDMTPDQATELHELHEMVKYNTSPWAGSALNTAIRIEAALTAATAADEARDRATLAAVQALAQARGIDPAPIVAAIEAVRDEAREQFGVLHQQLADAKAQLAQSRREVERLAATTTGD